MKLVPWPPKTSYKIGGKLVLLSWVNIGRTNTHVSFLECQKPHENTQKEISGFISKLSFQYSLLPSVSGRNWIRCLKIALCVQVVVLVIRPQEAGGNLYLSRRRHCIENFQIC